MPYFEYKENKIHYLVEGNGKPILLLNGIMMTTASWEPIVSSLNQNNTLIRLDLLDQGLSTKQIKAYTIDDQADLVAAFINHLSRDKINIVGISYGGYVGLNLAARYPSLVDKMIVFNSSADVDIRDQEMFKQFIHIASLDDAYAFYLTTIPLFYSPTFYQTHSEWMKSREAILTKFFENKTYRETVARLSQSCLSHDVISLLPQITAKTLLVSGEEDHLIPTTRQTFLADNIKDSYQVIMAKTGHVSPYENPVIFTSLIYGFINNPTNNFKI